MLFHASVGLRQDAVALVVASIVTQANWTWPPQGSALQWALAMSRATWSCGPSMGKRWSAGRVSPPPASWAARASTDVAVPTVLETAAPDAANGTPKETAAATSGASRCADGRSTPPSSAARLAVEGGWTGV